MFKVIAEDKFANRWEKGVSIGKSDGTDEHFYLTESGFKKSRTAKRPCEGEPLVVDLMSKIKGLPWNPTGTRGFDQGSLLPTKTGKDFTVAGNSVRRMYIAQSMVHEFGSTDGCPKCGAWGASHSAECIKRFEGLMKGAGRAFEAIPSDLGNQSPAGASVEISPDSVPLPSSSSSGPSSGSDG